MPVTLVVVSVIIVINFTKYSIYQRSPWMTLRKSIIYGGRAGPLSSLNGHLLCRLSMCACQCQCVLVNDHDQSLRAVMVENL